ncbi:MAG: ABC transporter ATP-binding protein [Phycisphaerales bacterium]|nr:ABC transporter ATP-binding protein [Phycisphaerales bacterium]
MSPIDRDHPIVRFADVHKAFGDQVVLRGVSLDLRAGETTVVLGPSGAGKSVLLKHIVGLLRPDRGRVFFRGLRIDNLSERRLSEPRKHIGFLFQMSALFDSMNVGDNVGFPLAEHTDLSPEDRAGRVAEALRTVGLDGLQHKLPSELSGGQRKRVALARAIILKPDLILYDEPTTGLDPIRADGINELIIKLRRGLNVSGVVVTHDLLSARRVADRVVVLYDGQIVADGTFSEVERSRHPYVMRFLSGRYDPLLDERVAPVPGARENDD